MRISINYKTRASKILDFSLDEIDEYAKRVKGHLKKCMWENVQKTEQIGHL